MNQSVKDFIEHLDFSTEKREELKEKGQAMPHGGYPIRNRADLKRAIQAFGRAKDKVKTKAWIIKRARELNLVDLLPDGWVQVKQSNLKLYPWQEHIVDFIEHHGVKGMKWGVRRSKAQLARSGDRTVFGKSPSRLTTDELNRRIRRMEAEKRYNELNKRDVSAGERLAGEILRESGKRVATTVISGAALYGIKKGIEKQFGESVSTGIFPKRKK